MTHYKVEYKVLRLAGMEEDASFQTFCGIDLREGDFDDALHFIGGKLNWCTQPPVDCPTCTAVFAAIANHNLDRGN